jgi:predicted enzyme related to lactoylglutathione lyase
MTTPKASSTPGHIDFIEFPSPNPEALSRTKAFCADVFGWSFRDQGKDYADVNGAGVRAGLNGGPEHRAAHPLAVVFAAQLDVTRARVLAAGGKITREVFAFPGGRRFHFTEPSGNELAVWSDQ